MTQYTLLWFSRKLLAYTFFKTECGSEVKKFHVSLVPTESRVLFSILKAMIVILLGWISTSKKYIRDLRSVVHTYVDGCVTRDFSLENIACLE